MISGLFLFIFFMKMVISVAPLIAKHFDRNAIASVIMQLEEENHSKEDPVKEKIGKEFWQNSPHEFLFVLPSNLLVSKPVPIRDPDHTQTFFPSVPTPPPNA